MDPQIAVSGTNVYVTWEEFPPLSNAEIFFAVSNNNGASFGTPINISNNGGTSLDAQIAVSGNNVYVTWRDATPGNFDTFVISNDRPFVGFGTSINISNNLGASFDPQIGAS